MTLTSEQAGNIDLLAEVPCKLVNVNSGSQMNYKTKKVVHYAYGYIENLKVRVTEYRINIHDSSLCKWFFGENFQTLTRGDTKRAIEKLSDLLRLPMQKARLTRIDLAQNIIVRYETPVYYNHLGILQFYKRLEQDRGLYYNNPKRILAFYDKVADYKHKRLPVPEMYQNRNVLRYEMRFTKQLLRQFNLPQLNAELLYNEQFYIDIIERWHTEYKNISKIRNSNLIDYTMIKTKRQLEKQALLLLINEQGGELEFYKKIAEAQAKGELTKKQAFDFRNLIKEAGKSDLLTCESDVITELDKKINEAVKYYV